MECPSCRIETSVMVAKVEYIYPDLFHGTPTFWRFISPKLALSITIVAFVMCLVLFIQTFVFFSQGFWLMSVFIFIMALFLLYIFFVCVKSIGKHQLKEYYRCNKCGLEWSWFKERKS
jgi:DNA-directed RNA polymerase subunit RPC12/RpoP